MKANQKTHKHKRATRNTKQKQKTTEKNTKRTNEQPVGNARVQLIERK